MCWSHRHTLNRYCSYLKCVNRFRFLASARAMYAIRDDPTSSYFYSATGPQQLQIDTGCISGIWWCFESCWKNWDFMNIFDFTQYPKSSKFFKIYSELRHCVNVWIFGQYFFIWYFLLISCILIQWWSFPNIPWFG